MRGNRTSIAIAVLLLGGLSGCGGGPTATIHGDVTVDNGPLPEGRIVYIPAGKPPMEGKIKEGKYSLKNVPEGPAKVQIYYPRMVGKKQMLPGSPPVEEYREGLPARYNLESDLKTDVKGGDNTINWPLKSK